MNYTKIHDSIINRSLNRSLENNYENHHIVPKCEGGDPNGRTTRLTSKEHKLIHKLRYKMTNILGNLMAYNWMKSTYESRRENAIIAAKLSHEILIDRNYNLYIEKQRKAGIAGGNKAKDLKLGWFSMTEEDKILSRNKGRNTTIRNKLGMFSDEFRKQKNRNQQKKLHTPNGDI